MANFLATSEGLDLVKAFVCIGDPKLRRAIVRLVEEITRLLATAHSARRPERSIPPALPRIRYRLLPLVAGHVHGLPNVGVCAKTISARQDPWP